MLGTTVLELWHRRAPRREGRACSAGAAGGGQVAEPRPWMGAAPQPLSCDSGPARGRRGAAKPSCITISAHKSMLLVLGAVLAELPSSACAHALRRIGSALPWPSAPWSRLSRDHRVVSCGFGGVNDVVDDRACDLPCPDAAHEGRRGRGHAAAGPGPALPAPRHCTPQPRFKRCAHANAIINES